jgi:hypothetical protein
MSAIDNEKLMQEIFAGLAGGGGNAGALNWRQ